jgi:hypothetical protein
MCSARLFTNGLRQLSLRWAEGKLHPTKYGAPLKDSQRNAEEPQIYKNKFIVEIGHTGDHPFLEYIRLDSRESASEENTNEIEEDGDEGKKDGDVDELSFDGLLNSWAQSCLGFLDAFPMFSSVAQYVNHGVSGQELIEFLEAAATNKESISKEGDDRTYTAYTLGRQHLDFAYRQVEKRRQFESAEAALSKAQLLAIISEYEAFMADLLRIAIKITPESFISSGQTVNATTIIRGENLDQIRTSIIEDHIADLQRGSHVDVVKTIFKQLKMSLPDDRSLQEFGEICLRRNTLTHANGVANKIYRSEMQKLGFREEEIPAEGERLAIDDRYMRRSIARVFQMGYFTGQLVWQHLQKNEREKSVKLIINHSHDFLVADYTKICGRLCKFGLNAKSPAGEIDRAYLIINLALSFLLNDKLGDDQREEGIRSALSKRDWSIIDSRFAMALCCVKEEYERFGELFDAVKDRDFDITDFMGLAIFTKARAQPIFKEKMLEHYGVEIELSDHGAEEEMRKDD